MPAGWENEVAFHRRRKAENASYACLPWSEVRRWRRAFWWMFLVWICTLLFFVLRRW
jgi:hypothetical protein